MKKIGLIAGIALIIIIFLIVFLLRKDNDKIMNYVIITNANSIKGTLDEKTRGYEVVEENNEYYLIIYNGEESVYYSSLEVLDVEIKNQKVNITVKLPDDEGMGEAFSYPKAVIKFDKEPKKVRVTYEQK